MIGKATLPISGAGMYEYGSRTFVVSMVLNRLRLLGISTMFQDRCGNAEVEPGWGVGMKSKRTK
jgi:hypothetical protein